MANDNDFETWFATNYGADPAPKLAVADLQTALIEAQHSADAASRLLFAKQDWQTKHDVAQGCWNAAQTAANPPKK